MSTLGVGVSDDFEIDPDTQRIVFEESETNVKCYLYPLGAWIPPGDDASAQQDSRTLAVEIDKSLHTITLAPREKEVDPDTDEITYGGPQTVFLVPI